MKVGDRIKVKKVDCIARRYRIVGESPKAWIVSMRGKRVYFYKTPIRTVTYSYLLSFRGDGGLGMMGETVEDVRP